MNFRLKYYLFFIFIYTKVDAQENTRKFLDLNHDGIKDSLIINHFSDNSYDYTDVTIWDGRSKAKFFVSEDYSFSSFFSIVPIYNYELERKNNKLLLIELERNLFTTKASIGIDATLEWLINAYSNAETNAGKDKIFDFSTYYTPRWIKGSIVLPGNYHVLLSSEKYKKLIERYFDDQQKNPENIWIDYYGENHKRTKLKEIFNDTMRHKTLYMSAHGVILKSQDRYSWLFISDGRITNIQEKLRWPTIVDAKMVGNYVFLRQINIQENKIYLYMIDYLNGRIIRLNNDYLGLITIKDFKIAGDLLILSDEYNSYNLSLKGLLSLVGWQTN